MRVNINGIDINYELKGSGKPVVLIHGWGCNIKTVGSIQDYLATWFSVYAIDLPGFGGSDDPKESWGDVEYYQSVRGFIETIGIENPTLIGHSVGGRISITLAANMKVDKVVLIDSAGIKKELSLKSKIKVKVFKLGKALLKSIPFLQKSVDEFIDKIKSKIGSTDYKNAKPVLRESMVRLVNRDLRDLLPSIKAPTLLVWGENDIETPVSDAGVMNSLIGNSGIALIKNAGHYPFLDNPGQFRAVLKAFLVKE